MGVARGLTGDPRRRWTEARRGGRERPRRVRRSEPVGSKAGGWGYPSPGMEWCPPRKAAAWLIGGEAEQAREVGSRGEDWGVGAAETRESNGTVSVCVPLVATWLQPP